MILSKSMVFATICATIKSGYAKAEIDEIIKNELKNDLKHLDIKYVDEVKKEYNYIFKFFDGLYQNKKSSELLKIYESLDITIMDRLDYILDKSVLSLPVDLSECTFYDDIETKFSGLGFVVERYIEDNKICFAFTKPPRFITSGFRLRIALDADTWTFDELKKQIDEGVKLYQKQL